MNSGSFLSTGGGRRSRTRAGAQPTVVRRRCILHNLTACLQLDLGGDRGDLCVNTHIFYRSLPCFTVPVHVVIGWLWVSSDLVHVDPSFTFNISAPARHPELHNQWPFLNTKLSFFRGNSPLSLHFQWKIPQKYGHFYCKLQ